ncbi:MAG: response regulator [Proteobacteria bacterium]|nr:response regulator [Pseudomonadota bacterium]
MYYSALPACYFPSTTFFVDDSREFLVNFTLQLEDSLAFQVYDSPYDALDALYASRQTPDYLSQRCITEYLDSRAWPMTNQTVNLNLAAIHSEVYNPQRFSEVSVVVVDYAMPGMNGLDFCQRIQNSPVKKILLTGRADERTVLEAFNEGLIDRYIEKNIPNVATVIKHAIQKLQRQYFQGMSDLIIRMVSVTSPTCLQDVLFAQFLKKICDENDVAEFYLTENSGSFLLLDKDANLSCLIVKNRQDLNLHYEMALDNKAPESVLDDLKSGRKIPYFSDNEGQKTSEWSDWSTFLRPAQVVQGLENYYYTIVKDPIVFNIQKEKITSYSEYLKLSRKKRRF